MHLQYKSFENTLGKGEIARNDQFLLFQQCFLPIWITFYHFHQIWRTRLKTFLRMVCEYGPCSSSYQCSTQYSFQATGCFPTKPSQTIVREVESYCNGYHQSLERNWLSGYRTSNLPFSSPIPLLTVLHGLWPSVWTGIKFYRLVMS